MDRRAVETRKGWVSIPKAGEGPLELRGATSLAHDLENYQELPIKTDSRLGRTEILETQ